MEIIKTIKDHLAKSTRNYITVQDGANRLKKQNAFHDKFLWSESDIISGFGSVESLLKALPGYGFSSGSVLLLRTKYSNNNYHDKGQFTLKLRGENPQGQPAQAQPTQKQNTNGMGDKHQTSTEVHTNPTMPYMGNPGVAGLGFTQVASNELTDLKVKEQRYFDLENKNRELVNELQDAKSEMRILKEENASLSRKLDTIQDKHQLEMDRKEIERKSFFESEAGVKAMESLGAALPLLLNKSAGVQAPALASPAMSQTKQQFIKMLSDPSVSDETILMLYHVFKGMEIEGFTEELAVLISKAQEHANDHNS